MTTELSNLHSWNAIGVDPSVRVTTVARGHDPNEIWLAVTHEDGVSQLWRFDQEGHLNFTRAEGPDNETSSAGKYYSLTLILVVRRAENCQFYLQTV